MHPPTVGDIDPGGAVNGSGMESVCCERSQRGQPPDTTGSVDLPQPWSCRCKRCRSAYHKPFTLPLSLSLSHWPDTHSHTHLISICLSLQIWIWTHDGAIGVHREMRSLLSTNADGLFCLEVSLALMSPLF